MTGSPTCSTYVGVWTPRTVGTAVDEDFFSLATLQLGFGITLGAEN